MKIEVQLFAFLGKYMPSREAGGACTLEVADGSTVGQVLTTLKVPAGEAKLFFRNGVHAREGDVLREGDRLAVFQPVAGG